MIDELIIKNSLVSRSRSYPAVASIKNTSKVVVKDDLQLSLVDVETGKISKICECYLSFDIARKHTMEVVYEKDGSVNIYTLEFTNKTKQSYIKKISLNLE